MPVAVAELFERPSLDLARAQDDRRGDEDVLESLNLDEESRNLRKKLPKGEHKEIVQNLQRSKINVRLRKAFLR